MAQIPRMRHLRYRKPLDGRLRRFEAWVDGRVVGLKATADGKAFTADAVTNQIAIAAHGYQSGDGPFTVSSTTTLPGGLTAGSHYWVNAVTAGALTLHTSELNARNGTAPVDILDAGTGTHTLTPDVTKQMITDYLRKGISPRHLTLSADIDNLV